MERYCLRCGRPLDPDAHGNQKMHPHCSYEHKKERQKEKYPIGNKAKIFIQKNESIAARLHKLDKDKKGISVYKVIEEGFKFDGPTEKINHLYNAIYMIEKYGYSIKEFPNETLIIFYHVSELQLFNKPPGGAP